MPQQSVRIADQRINGPDREPAYRSRRWQACRVVVVMGAEVIGDDLACGGDFAANPTDRADQLGHGARSGRRITNYVARRRRVLVPNGLGRQTSIDHRVQARLAGSHTQ